MRRRPVVLLLVMFVSQALAYATWWHERSHANDERARYVQLLDQATKELNTLREQSDQLRAALELTTKQLDNDNASMKETERILKNAAAALRICASRLEVK